jgi:hypothetical protein
MSCENFKKNENKLEKLSKKLMDFMCIQDVCPGCLIPDGNHDGYIECNQYDGCYDCRLSACEGLVE